MTDMSSLFCAPWVANMAARLQRGHRRVGHLRRHDDDAMFYAASAFNQDIGGWAVDSVTR